MDEMRAGIVRVEGAEGRGTGFLVSSGGLIVTCAHLLGQVCPSSVPVVFYPPEDEICERKARGIPELWERGYYHDIAFLLVDDLPEGIKVLPLGPSGQGEKLEERTVKTLGFPNLTGVEGLPIIATVQGETLDPTTGERRLIIKAAEIDRGFSGGPLWDIAKRYVIGMISRTVWKSPFEQLACAIPSETLRAVCTDLSLRDFCPYKGLQPYSEDDAAIFFGREEYLEQLLHLLAEDPRLLTLLGPVGSGKTSLLRAGLIPRLRQGNPALRPASHVIYVIPSSSPLDQLMKSQPLADHPGARLADRLRSWRARHAIENRPVFLLDQFEGLFNQVGSEQQAVFIEQLVELIQSDLCSIIIAMRDDYYSDLARYTNLIQIAERHLSNIPPMRYSDLQAVIQKPAQAADLSSYPVPAR